MLVVVHHGLVHEDRLLSIGEEVVQSNHASQSNNQDIYALDATTGIADIRQITTALGPERDADWAPLCTGRCIPTPMTLRIAKTKTSLKANGQVLPPVPGQDVTVTLSRKKGAGDKKVRGIDATVAADGTFNAKFTRPNAGKCKVTATYAGDADHEASSRVKIFAC